MDPDGMHCGELSATHSIKNHIFWSFRDQTKYASYSQNTSHKRVSYPSFWQGRSMHQKSSCQFQVSAGTQSDLEDVLFTFLWALACDFQESCDLTFIQSFWVPLTFYNLAHLHREIVRSLLTANLKAWQQRMSDDVPIHFSKVISYRLHRTLFVNRESG
jgi:hypothetical protein